MWREKRPPSLGRLSLEPAAVAVNRYKPIEEVLPRFDASEVHDAKDAYG